MRNEQNDHGNASHIYQNITITDNLIYSGSANGIGVGVANNVLVANNTLLWNQQAVTIKATGDTSYPPRIRLSELITNGEVIDNIAPRIVAGDDIRLSGNVLISYNAARGTWVGDHFVDAAAGGDIGPSGGWQLRPNSPLVGIGSSFSAPGARRPG
jgi:hypothetical protein